MTKTSGGYAAPAETPRAYRTGAPLFPTERSRLEHQQAAMFELRQPLENREPETMAAGAASEELPASTTASNSTLAEKEAALNVREASLKARERELSSHQPLAGVKLAKQDARAVHAAEQRRALRHKPGGLLDESQSRAILLLYFHLVETRKRPDKAVDEVSVIFGIGKAKIYAVRNRWDANQTLLTTSAEGRGITSGEDRRRKLNLEQRAKLCTFIAEQHEAGNKVVRRTVAEWVQMETGCDISDPSAGRLMKRLGYKRRDGTYCALIAPPPRLVGENPAYSVPAL